VQHRVRLLRNVSRKPIRSFSQRQDFEKAFFGNLTPDVQIFFIFIWPWNLGLIRCTETSEIKLNYPAKHPRIIKLSNTTLWKPKISYMTIVAISNIEIKWFLFCLLSDFLNNRADLQIFFFFFNWRRLGLWSMTPCTLKKSKVLSNTLFHSLWNLSWKVIKYFSSGAF
jgi:hypothetical protein